LAAAKGRDNMSRKIAFGGILTALSVVLVYFAAYMPSGKLGLYSLASVIIAIAVVELGIKLGAVVYIASAILIFFITGSLNALLLYILFFGCYPLLKYYLEKQRRAAVELLMKFAVFNLLVIVSFVAFKLLLGIWPVNIEGFSVWILAGLAIAAQIIFLIYDYILSRLISYYINRVKSAIRI
jgi:hypothetical protein